MRILFILSMLLLSLLNDAKAQKLAEHRQVLMLMGTRFELTATAYTQAQAEYAVQKGIEEISRIEALISSWKPRSQTTLINENAGIKAVKVEKELFALIQRSIKISALTLGAFDISFSSIERLYTFDKKEHPLPSMERRKNSVQHIDYSVIELNELTNEVFLPDANMRIGFGGIGKGYAANKAKQVMKKCEGVQGGLVNAAGDLIAWGKSGRKEGWPIQISNPRNTNESLGWLNIQDLSIVTSGDYEKYFTSNGVRYAHIIDPSTGLPTTGIKSVSIISPDTEVGDALATAVFVLGVEDGLELINQLKDIEALIIDDHDHLHSSENLKLNNYEYEKVE